MRVVRARHRYGAELLTAAIVGAAVGAGLVYFMNERRGGRSLRPMVRRLQHNLADYVGSAREAIDDAVSSELKDLRRSIRRQRKRFGV